MPLSLPSSDSSIHLGLGRSQGPPKSRWPTEGVTPAPAPPHHLLPSLTNRAACGGKVPRGLPGSSAPSLGFRPGRMKYSPPPPVPLWCQTAVRGLRAGGEVSGGPQRPACPGVCLAGPLTGTGGHEELRGEAARAVLQGGSPRGCSLGWGCCPEVALATTGPPSPQPAPAQGSSGSSCCSRLLRSCSSYFLVFCSRHALALGARCHG